MVVVVVVVVGAAVVVVVVVVVGAAVVVVVVVVVGAAVVVVAGAISVSPPQAATNTRNPRARRRPVSRPLSVRPMSRPRRRARADASPDWWSPALRPGWGPCRRRVADVACPRAHPAPVAQRIEHRPPEPCAWVRVPPGAPESTTWSRGILPTRNRPDPRGFPPALDRDWVKDLRTTVWSWARRLVQYEFATFDQLQRRGRHMGLGHRIVLEQSVESHLSRLTDGSGSCAALISGAAAVERGSAVPWKPLDADGPFRQPIEFADHRAGRDPTPATTDSVTPCATPVSPSLICHHPFATRASKASTTA